MSLYKRAGGVWWYDFTVNGQRHRASTQLRSKKDALEIETRARRAAVMGEGVERPSLTLAQVADKWFEATQRNTKSYKTTGLRIRTLLACLPGETRVSDIDAPDVADALSRRRAMPTRQTRASAAPRAPSDSTVNRDIIDSTLRPMLRYAREILKQKTHDIPWQRLRMKEPKERVRSFSPAELQAWREHLPHWHRPLLDFMARYGVRLSEMFFRPDQVNVADGRLTITGRKSGKDLTIPLLPEDAAPMAARVGRAQAGGLPTVWFREMKRGELRAIRYRGFQSASATALKAAGIIDARPCHDFRHHAATTMLRATGNMKTVQRLLGHADIASTARYAHADDEDVFAALRHTYATPAEAGEEKASDAEGLAATASGT